MNQFWTPLSKVFGLSESKQQNIIDSPTVNSNWPALFEVFQKIAYSQWVSAWQRHREVSPQDVLSIRSLAIQAGNAEIQSQLDSWCNEGTSSQLIEWLVNGPWNTPEIRQCVYFDQLTELTFLPFESAPTQTSRSAYDDAQTTQSTFTESKLIIVTDHVWMAPPAPQPPPPPEPIKYDAWVEIVDIRGSRQFALKGNFFIFGKPKTMAWPDGQNTQLKDGETIEWQGESAVYVAIEGHHVSGLHLALRLYENGFDFQDLGSSNSTFDGTKAIHPNVWHSPLKTQTLNLGGPAQDLPQDAPRLRITAGLPTTAKPTQPTPLRPQNGKQAPSASIPIELLLEGSNGWRHTQQVHTLPCQIGRDATCDCVIPSEFSKVSRHHLVIEAWDATKQSLLLRDTSTHGVLVQSGSMSGPPKQGAWLKLGSQLLIGSSKNSPSVLITLARSASDN